MSDKGIGSYGAAGLRSLSLRLHVLIAGNSAKSSLRASENTGRGVTCERTTRESHTWALGNAMSQSLSSKRT